MAFSIGDGIGLFSLLRDIVKDSEDAKDLSLTELADRIEPDTGIVEWPEVIHPKLRKRLTRRAVGRGQEILRLAELVEGDTTSVITAMYGTGGIGKTTLAMEFLRFGLKSHRLQGIWIVNAETSSTMIEEILELGVEIGIPVTTVNETAAQKVLAAIADRGTPWLILFDNAPDRTGIDPFLIEGKHLRYIVTSRDRDWPDASPLALDVLPVEDAVKLLREESGRDEEYGALAKALDHLPLALVIAGAYLRNARDISPDAYLSMLADRLNDTGALDYPASVKATVELSVDALPNDDARDLLSLAAYLSQDDLWLEMIGSIVGQLDLDWNQGAHDWPDFVKRIAENPARLHDAAAALERASLLRREGEGGEARLTLHRLTQAVMRARPGGYGERHADAAARIVNVFAPYDFDEPAQWGRYARLVPQGEALLPHAPPSQASDRAFSQIGGYLHARGDYSGAIRLYGRATEISAEINGTDSALHALHLNNLASSYEDSGDLESAEPLYIEAIAIDEAVLGDHPQTASHINNLAGLYVKQKAFAKAEPLFRRAEQIDREALGEDHPLYAIDLGNLGALYDNWAEHLGGDVEKQQLAAEYSKRALAVTRRAVGEMHPDTATRLNNLATLHARSGDFRSAIPAMRQAFTIFVDLLGPDHPNTQASLNSFVAMIVERDGDVSGVWAELEKVSEETDAIRVAHIKWGIAKLAEIAARHGVEATDLQAIADAVQAEAERLRAGGAPQQKWTWPLTEFRGVTFALQQAQEWGLAGDK